MGYRSDVTVLIYPPARKTEAGEEKYQLLKTLVNTTFNHVYTCWQNNLWTWHTLDHVLEFNVPDAKWYDGYEEVRNFTTMLEELPALGYCVEFVRIGEDFNDIEREDYSPEHLYIEGLLDVVRYTEKNF